MNEYRYSDIEIGHKESFFVDITSDMIEKFFDITGDCNPLHRDKTFAKEKKFDDRVVYGMLTASFISTLAGVYLPGKYSLIHSVESKFIRPVYVGDRLEVIGCQTANYNWV